MQIHRSDVMDHQQVERPVDEQKNRKQDNVSSAVECPSVKDTREDNSRSNLQ